MTENKKFVLSKIINAILTALGSIAAVLFASAQ